MRDVKQSDNINTVGWRNIWGNFTLAELKTITNALPKYHMSHTSYTFRYDVNGITKLEKFIQHLVDSGRTIPHDWGYYIDYPEEYHDKVWTIINNWLPLIQ